MAAANSVILYLDTAPAIMALEPADAGALFVAILQHAGGNCVEISTLPGVIRPLFMMFSAQIDRDKAKYAEVCKERAESGRKGGLKKSANAGKSKQMLANAGKSSKSKQMLANAGKSSKSWQTLANLADSDSDSDSDINKEISLTRDKETLDAFSLSAEDSAPLTQSALNPKATSFKHWTKEQLKNAVAECVAAHPEFSEFAADFVDYWYEPTASGKPRLWREKAWDTTRRLRTWEKKEGGHSVAARPVSGHSAHPEPGTREWEELHRREMEAF